MRENEGEDEEKELQEIEKREYVSFLKSELDTESKTVRQLQIETEIETETEDGIHSKKEIEIIYN